MITPFTRWGGCAAAIVVLAAPAASQEVPLEERARIEGYIKLLADDSAVVRRDAEDALVALGDRARRFVEAALTSPSSEVRSRLRAVLGRLDAAARSETRDDLTWSGLRGGPQRSGIAGGELPAALPELAWKTRVYGMELLQGSVVPGTDRIACLSRDGHVRCFASDDGHRLWLARIEARVTASAVLAANRLVVPTEHGLIALDLQTGRIAWSHDADYGCGAAPAITGGRVYAAFRNDGIRAFDLGTGEELFRRPLAPSGALLVDGDLIVVGTEDARLVRLHPVSGKVLWRFELGSEPNMGPTLAAPGVVVVMADNRYLRAVSSDDGKVLWKRRLKSVSKSESLAAAAGRVYLTDRRGALMSFDALTGKPLWRRHEGMTELGGPCATAKRVLWSSRGRMMCRDARSGDYLWRVDLPEYESAVPAARDGQVYVLTNNYLYAFE